MKIKKLILILCILIFGICSLSLATQEMENITEQEIENTTEQEVNTTIETSTIPGSEDQEIEFATIQIEKNTKIRDALNIIKANESKSLKKANNVDTVEISNMKIYKLEGTTNKDIKKAQKTEPLDENDIVKTNLLVEFDADFYRGGRNCMGMGVGGAYATVVKGDITGTGNIDVTDLSTMQDELVDSVKLKGPYAEAADINSDNNIDVLDLSNIQEYIVNN